jgi:hypothetical protein
VISLSYNSKAIKTDVNAKPIPQYYNPVTDEYEVLQGTGGAARQVLYGPDGQPISVADNKLAVRAAELETKIEAVRVLLNALTEEDFATQTTLAQILAKLDGVIDGTTGAARQVLYGSDGQPISIVDNKLAVRAEEVETLLTALKGKDFATETTLAQILAKMIASPATEAKQAEMLAALGSQSTAEKQDALADLVGAIDAEAVSDPAAAGAVIALLKGLLSRLQTLEGKIDGITDGTTPAKTETQLKGSLIEDEQAVPIRYPAMEKRYTEYDNYVLPAGASIDRSIYEDIKGFRYVNLVLWRDDTTIPVRIQLYSLGLLNEWFNNTIEDIGAGQKVASIIDYPIIPTTCMYVTNMGDTAVTLKGIAIKART